MLTSGSAWNNERFPIKWTAVAALCFISGFVLCYITGAEALVKNDYQEGNNGQWTGFLITHKSTTAAMQSPASSSPLSNSRHVVKNHSSWCPSATCHNTDLCHPCDRRFLILLATGRSGSTSMMYMLDSLPGVRMSGENNAILNHLQQLVNGIRTQGK